MFDSMLILFDLDGTLTDPFEGISRSVSYALDCLGLPALTLREQRMFIGPPLHDSFAALGLDESDSNEAVAHYREYFTEQGIFENVVYGGVEQALAELAQRNVQLAVATSKPTAFAERILSHFELANYFEFVSGATMDGSRRHKTDIIDYALMSLGQAHTAAVMVGDRAQDIAGAKASGVRSLGVRWGYAEPGELEAAGADQIIETPAALVDTLTSS